MVSQPPPDSNLRLVYPSSRLSLLVVSSSSLFCLPLSSLISILVLIVGLIQLSTMITSLDRFPSYLYLLWTLTCQWRQPNLQIYLMIQYMLLVLIGFTSSNLHHFSHCRIECKTFVLSKNIFRILYILQFIRRWLQFKLHSSIIIYIY